MAFCRTLLWADRPLQLPDHLLRRYPSPIGLWVLLISDRVELLPLVLLCRADGHARSGVLAAIIHNNGVGCNAGILFPYTYLLDLAGQVFRSRVLNILVAPAG